MAESQTFNSRETSSVPTIFITDLDGTLLGHDDFGFAVIRDDILSFLERGVAIIPNSSKTRREIEHFCGELGVTLPFVCENGAALLNANLLWGTPDALAPRQIDVGISVERLMSMWVHSVEPGLRMRCDFLDAMEEAEQSRILGLSGDHLARALAREFSVLFLFNGDEGEFLRLRSQLQDAGLAVHRGGRVCCLSGRHDKSTFNHIIRGACPAEHPAPLVIGFGDSENDVSLLCASDVACVVPRPGAPLPALPDPPENVIIAPEPAPAGWIIAANAAFRRIQPEMEA